MVFIITHIQEAFNYALFKDFGIVILTFQKRLWHKVTWILEATRKILIAWGTSSNSYSDCSPDYYPVHTSFLYPTPTAEWTKIV